MGKNVNIKGRNAEARHVRLYHSVTGTAAWRDLSGNAIKVLVALMRLDKGGDNGRLFLSVRKAADETGLNRKTAAAALADLEAHGFIAATQRGHFKVKGGAATCWRLTWQGAPGHAPSRDFEHWAEGVGNKSRSQKTDNTAPKNGPVPGNGNAMVPKIGTATTETADVSVAAVGPFSGTQIVCHGHGAGKRPRNGSGNNAGASADLQASLRSSLISLLADSPVGTQTRLAQATAIPGGTLSKFLRDGRPIGQSHFVSLQLEYARISARLRDAA